MTVQYITPRNVAQAAYTRGFRGTALVTIVAICGAESSFNTFADNGIAAGIAQINYHAHTQFPRDRLYNYSYNLDAAYQVSGGGTNFYPWSTYDADSSHPYNNGAYRKFLATARAAVKKVDPSITSGILVGGGPGTFAANLPPDNEKAIDLTIGGGQVVTELGYALIAADVQFTTTEASQLTLTFDDVDYKILSRFKLEAGPWGTPIEHANTRWRIHTLTTQPGTRGPQTQMVCQTSGVMRMRGFFPSGMKNVSPTQYMERVCKTAGLDFVGEPLGTRPDIGPHKTTDPVTGQKRRENAWEIGQRLAANHDLVAYESDGTYYFGTPAFIGERAKVWQLSVRGLAIGWGDTAAQQDVGEIVEAASWPTLGATQLGNGSEPQRTLSVEVRRGQGKRLRGGDELNAVGVPVLTDPSWRSMTITGVQWDPTDIAGGPVTIQAADHTNWASKAKGRKSTVGGSSAADNSSGPVKRGTKSALDFVSFCLAQRGDRYGYGATPSLTDPNPDEEDCSSLVQWAAYQCGVTLPRVSGDQWAYCEIRQVSVADALWIRGALLFIDGGGVPGGEHVAVSLGDGSHDMAAHTASVPLNRQVAVWTTTASEWDRAALIPGLSYGTGGSGHRSTVR